MMNEKKLINRDTPWYRRIKLYRTAAGYTQQEVANKVGVVHRRYWGWEVGRNIPNLEHKQKLAEILEVDQEDLFGGPEQDFEGLKRSFE